MKRYYNIFSAILMLALGSTYKTQACGGGYGDRWGYYSSIIDIHIIGDQSLLYFVENSLTASQNLPESHQNIDLWVEYFDGVFSYQEVEEVIYKMTIEEVLSMAKSVPILLSGKVPDVDESTRLKNNRLIQHLIKRQMSEHVTYLLLAKQTYKMSQKLLSHWRWNDHEREASSEVDDYIEVVSGILKKVKSDFLKERFVYQIIRLASSAGKWKQVLDIYKTHKNYLPQEEGLISGWIHGHVGRAYFYTGKKYDAAYEYIKLYELAPEKYIPAAQSIQWIKDRDYRKMYDRCKTDSERDALTMLRAAEKDAYDNLGLFQELMLKPTSPILEMLALNAFQSYEKENNKAKLKELLKQCRAIAQIAESERGGYWYSLSLASAILADMPEESLDLLHTYAHQNAGARIHNQWQVLMMLYESKFGSVRDMEKVASITLPKLVFDTDQEEWSRYLNHAFLYERYRKEDDSVMMFAAKLNTGFLRIDPESKYRRPITRFGDIYWNDVSAFANLCSDNTLLMVHNHLADKRPSKFQKFYTGMLHQDVIMEYLSTRAASHLDWDLASMYADKMVITQPGKTPGGVKLIVDPFTSFYYHKRYNGNKASGSLGHYTRKQAIEMIRKKKMKADLGDEQACLDYAMALYNISYYGIDWMLTRFAWSSYNEFLYFHDREIDEYGFGDEYFELKEAEKYALRAANDKSLNDDAYYLAALSSQHRLLRELDMYDRKYRYDYMLKSEKSKYFDEIDRNNKRLADHCYYFRYYTYYH